MYKLCIKYRVYNHVPFKLRQLDDLMRQLEEAQETNQVLTAECDHYKGGLEETVSVRKPL